MADETDRRGEVRALITLSCLVKASEVSGESIWQDAEAKIIGSAACPPMLCETPLVQLKVVYVGFAGTVSGTPAPIGSPPCNRSAFQIWAYPNCKTPALWTLKLPRKAM